MAMPTPLSGRRKRLLAKKGGTLVQSGQAVAGSTIPASGNQLQGRSGGDRDRPKTLDGFMLLDRCRVEFPDEVTQAVLSGLNIHSVVAEDLLFFSNLSRVDMSDNEAPFEPFGSLPALAELDFQCNAATALAVPPGSFQCLEVLNLAFNCLTTNDIEELANLLRIRELYLGNNRIRSIPPVMDRFSRLETLSLESNGLPGADVFAFLAMMPRLRNLNLSHNKLTHFPESALTVGDKRGAGFASLAYLNLSHNMIANEAAVLHTCELRALRKLILYGNPFTRAAVSSSDPSTLVFDPIPTMTARLATRSAEQVVTVVVAFPETKKKAHASYEDVEIYKMVPNQVPLQPAFRNRATSFLLDESRAKKLETIVDLSGRRSESETSSAPTAPKPLRIDSSDSTFLTGVGIEDEVMESLSHGISAELPAVPLSILQRSLAADPKVQPTMNSRVAINALRYQLQHPLTSHDDSDLYPPNFQKPTQAQMERQRRRPVPSDTAASNHSTKPAHQNQHANQLHAKDRFERTNMETSVDEALDSLLSTAKKINVAYSPKGRA